VQKN